MSTSAKTLARLRREIDAIDDSLHDLVMRRAQVVDKVGRAKSAEASGALRPAREAEILRRLVARHRGDFPKEGVVRLWRELMGTFTGLQQHFSVAVYLPEDDLGYWCLARDQFGAVVPMVGYRSPGEVVGAVMDGTAAAGVLPLPRVEEPEPWWPNLLGGAEEAPQVATRLPFSGRSGGPESDLEALAIARAAPEETGRDRTYLVLEAGIEVSRALLASSLDKAKLTPIFVDTRAEGEGVLILIEVEGFVAAEDRRIELMLMDGDLALKRVHRLGGYAIPFTPDELDGSAP